MARSLRSSRVKTNKSQLRHKVFNSQSLAQKERASSLLRGLARICDKPNSSMSHETLQGAGAAKAGSVQDTSTTSKEVKRIEKVRQCFLLEESLIL